MQDTHEERATKLGVEAGKYAAIDSPNEQPDWLSGEWSDSETPATLMRRLGLDEDNDDADWLCNVYEDAASDAYFNALEDPPNPWLADFAERVASQTPQRRTCSCGEAWADEPGHDKENAHSAL